MYNNKCNHPNKYNFLHYIAIYYYYYYYYICIYIYTHIINIGFSFFIFTKCLYIVINEGPK